MVELLTTARYAVVGGANVYFGTREINVEYTAEDDASATSLSRNPLMHMWYLGVEEQFYALYPWLFATAHVLGSQFATYSVLGSTLAMSFMCALGVDSHSGPGFFLLQYRGWEVLVGVVTCHVLVVSRRFVNARLWPQLTFVGLVSLGLWLFYFPEHSRKATLCALAGTVAFFISGHGHDWQTIHTLPLNELHPRDVPLLNYLYGLRPCAYFGRLSYALYLWHFPVQVLCADYKEDIQRATGLWTEAEAFLAQLALLIALSALTHHLVENPFRWWKPTRWYLPALCVLLLATALEVWLGLLSGRMQDGAVANLIRPHSNALPPLLSKAELAVLLFAAIAPALYFSASPLLQIRPRDLLLLLVGAAGALLVDQCAISRKPVGTNVLTALGDVPPVANVRAAPVPPRQTAFSAGQNWTKWSGGAPSFANTGCACRAATPTNTNRPPDAGSDPDLPACFDLDRWAATPMERYEEERKHTQKWPCYGANTDTALRDHSADNNWIDCRVSVRAGKSQRTAFVFGSSVSYRLRWAVAHALGDKFSLFGISQDAFGSHGLLQLLLLVNDTHVNNRPRIHFGMHYPLKSSLSSQWSKNINQLAFIRRIGEILDKHLGKGDIIFIDWRAPIPTDSSCTKKQECERYEGADFFCCGSPAGAPQRRGLARLGSIASARGARLVVTTGMPRRAEPKQQNRLRQREEMLREFAAEHPDVLYWPIDQPFCKSEAQCGRGRLLIPGTNLTVYPDRGSQSIEREYRVLNNVDEQHMTKHAAAFAAPFLCSLLKRNSLLPSPTRTELVKELRHERLRVNMQKMRDDGADDYRCRIFKPPARGSAITAIEHIFEPPAHRDMIHHNFLRYCTRCPAAMATMQAGESFSCQPTWMAVNMPECMTMVLGLGMDQGRTALPRLHGKQLAIQLPDDAHCLLLEIHYKAPPLEEPRLKGKQLLRQADAVWDSSGMRLTFQRPASGDAFQFVQFIELGPRTGHMLTVPPGLPNQKVTNACPGTCLQAAKVPEIHIMGVQQHAHSAATTMFSEVGNLNSSTSAVFAAVTDYQKYRLQERVIWLPEPIRFSPDDVIKVTCVYNTTGRTTKTSLGATLRDEMCFMYAWISPPVRNFNQCWHVDPNQIQGLNGQSKPGKRGCYAQCGLHGSPEFKLPRGSSSWSSQDVDARVMAALGDRWPGAPVCED